MWLCNYRGTAKTAVIVTQGLQNKRHLPEEPMGNKGASVCADPPGECSVYVDPLGSAGKALWQGTKENTQATDGLCCLPPIRWHRFKNPTE